MLPGARRRSKLKAQTLETAGNATHCSQPKTDSPRNFTRGARRGVSPKVVITKVLVGSEAEILRSFLQGGYIIWRIVI